MAIVLTPTLTPASASSSAPVDVAYGVTVTGATAPLTYLWDFGDGNQSTTASGTHTYGTGRTYVVTLLVTDALGYTASWASSYVVGPALSASFIAVVTLGAGGTNSVAFTLGTLYGSSPYTYLWDFGDGTTSTSANPTHVYAEAGGYLVTLTVTDAQAHESIATSRVEISNPMSVTLTAAPVIGSEPIVVDFTAVAASGTAPYTYVWNFGDGGTATGAAVSHTFTTSGPFEVLVAVVDALGHDTGGSIVVDVLAELRSFPLRIPEKGVPPFPVTFYANPQGGKLPYTFAWDFQDGGTSTEQNPVYNFLIPGYYDVTLVVTDGLGRQATSVVAVDANLVPPIYDPLDAQPYKQPESGTVPFPVSFYAMPMGGKLPYTFAWDFQDGHTSTEENPVHNFNQSGFYNVTLTVTDSLGSTVSRVAAVDAGVAVRPPGATISIYHTDVTIYGRLISVYGF
jgi:PKD repeat protein